MHIAVTTLLAVASFAAGAIHAAHAQSSQTSPSTSQSTTPAVETYMIEIEVKALSERRNRGLSDTFNRPGAELTITGAHESGLIGLVQLGSVRKEIFPNSNGLLLTGAVGYRGGDPEKWHYGAGIAHEYFPKAEVKGAPARFDWSTGTPVEFTDTRFDTTYALFELGYGMVETRYLYVLSKDLRGNNTATLCGTAYLPQLLAGGDPAKAISCYGDGLKHTGGSHLFDLDFKFPLNEQTRLILHAGYQITRNFSDANLFDYRLGIAHQRWGIEFGLDLIGASLKNRDFAIATDSSGRSKSIDKTVLVASVAKRF